MTSDCSVFHVRKEGNYWLVRREDTGMDEVRDLSKTRAVSGAFRLAKTFGPSVVIVHHEHGPPTRKEFG